MQILMSRMVRGLHRHEAGVHRFALGKTLIFSGGGGGGAQRLLPQLGQQQAGNGHDAAHGVVGRQGLVAGAKAIRA
jgi:hypothetical protein